MNHQLIKRIKAHAPTVAAFLALVIFTGNAKHEKEVTANCCSGYSISIDKLQQFMLDSLHGNQFEGGVFAKADLLNAINKISGDSLYLMNLAKNCSFNRPCDLAITSPTANGVVFTRQPNCYPCPGKACCPAKACVARINRTCIKYTSLQAFTGTGKPSTIAAEE